MLENVNYVVNKIGEEAEKIVGKKVKPTYRDYKSEIVVLRYMLWDLNTCKGYAEMDGDKFYKLKSKIENLCKELSKEGRIDYYFVPNYKGMNIVHGCWKIDCYREKLEERA